MSQSTDNGGPPVGGDSGVPFTLERADAPVGVFAAHLDGTLLYVNPWLARHTGFPSPTEAIEAINRDPARYFADPDRLPDLTEQLAREGEATDFELPFLRPDGERLWLSLHCRLVDDEEGYRIEGFATDIGKRKLSEEALCRNEERYRAIVEDQTEFICRYAPDGTLSFVNEAYARYFGRSRDELIDSRFSPHIPAEDQPAVQRLVETLCPRSPVVSMEHRVLMPFGGIRWNLWTLRAIYTPGGALVEYQAVGRDVTEQKLTVQALRKSEERFRLLAENMSELVCLMPPDAERLLYVSPSCYRLLGYAPEEMAGLSLFRFLHPEDGAAFRASLERGVLSGRGALQSVVRVRRRESEYLWLEIYVSAVRDGQGEVTGLVASARDVTERKAAELALSAAEEQYRSLFENSIQGIFRTSPKGRLLVANPALARIFGFDSPEEMTAHYHDVGLQMYVDPQRNRDFRHALLEEGEVAHYESQVYRKDGAIIWISENARGVYDADGNLAYYEGALMDITERKRFEKELAALNSHLENLVEERTRGLLQKAAELEEANRRLTELDEMKSTLLSSVSHELRTPLTSIRGFAKLVDRDFMRRFAPLAEGDPLLAKKSEDMRSNLRIIEEQSRRLTELINSFLELSAIESGSMEWQDGTLSLPDVVAQAVDAAQILFQRRPRLTLTVDVAEPLPEVRGDAKRIVQVLVNLLDNAVKFTRQGNVTLRARALKSLVRLEVADTGPGIAPAELTCIFDTFQQGGGRNDTLSDKPAGTGLGLAICRRIIERHNGRIWAESTPGHGSTFIIELPAADAA
ncbi:MAG: PAS domain-containing sensor histidine kinase [Desulfovibrionaceae bacterium]|jgi:PAS domain S-box-containing protein|nr:PAS domain-containing sensor histidine kinase [Desulfovibrionaceae bacterium]